MNCGPRLADAHPVHARMPRCSALEEAAASEMFCPILPASMSITRYAVAFGYFHIERSKFATSRMTAPKWAVNPIQ